jgi:asparagine synthase (glutamine-hydrolysing)
MDEGFYMQKVIDRCHVNACFTFPDDNQFIQDIETLFYHQEEPFGSASIYAQYAVMKLARENNVTVLLDGQGADEMLAGYHAYFKSFFREIKNNNPELYKQERNGYLKLHKTNTVNGIAELGFKRNLRETQMYSLLQTVYESVNQQLSPTWHKNFQRERNNADFYPDSGFGSLNQHLAWNATCYGLEQLLRYADRNSMAHSREVRLPYLSHELVEYVFSLDASFKIKQGWTKWLMRKAYDKLLPQEIAWRKDKIGYEPPHQQWMLQPKIRDRIQESKKKLVAEKVLHPNVLKNGIGNTANKNRGWSYWMAGMLVTNGR